MDGGQCILSPPLASHTFDKVRGLSIVHDGLKEFWITALQRAEEYVDISLLHLRAEGVQEACEAFGRPGTAGEVLCGVEFVLRHHHTDADALGPISIDEAAEVAGIGLEVSRLLDKHVLA